MSRGTIQRQWTPDEVAQAKVIVGAVAAGSGGLVGTRSVLRVLGWGYTKRAHDRVYDLMPLAVILASGMYPGKALFVQPDHVYRIGDEPLMAMRTGMPRVKRAYSGLERVLAEWSGPLTGSTDFAHIVALKQVTLALNALDPAIFDAVIGEIAKALKAEGGDPDTVEE